ncbi:MAG TPA: HAMP domain-containing sensor histidine kinase [Candidatus Nitrosopolaris sp.]
MTSTTPSSSASSSSPSQSEDEYSAAEEKTELLYGAESAVARGVQFMQNVKVSMDLFGEKNGPSIIMEFDVYKNNYIDVIRRGGRIRLITEITNENLHYCKGLVNIVTELRHLEGLIGGIAVSESEYMSTTTLRWKQLLTQVFYSSAEEVVKQGQYIFDTFWNKAIPADDRIRELEEGIKPDFIETIRDPYEVQKIAFDLIKQASKEILTIFSTSNAFERQKRAGAIESLKEAASIRGIKVRILTPFDERIKKLAEELAGGIKKETTANNDRDDVAYDSSNTTKHVENLASKNNNNNSNKIKIRFIEPQLQTKVSILIVDRKYSLSVEVKDDTKSTSEKAMGLTSYSNSKSTVLSYVSIFESLWTQLDLYEQLKKSNTQQEVLIERLKAQDISQKEFINVAAHELRTPIQPILGLSDILLSKNVDREHHKEILQVIKRNAERLQRLSEDILDIAKIESHALKLNRERFDLGENIDSVVKDITSQIKDKYDVKISFVEPEYPFFVEGDRTRIYQVISNLISNSVKFTQRGDITITAEIIKNNNDSNDDNGRLVIVRIKDSGTGIDPEIKPRLFSKFSTTSDSGTGLGLYISKNIIEAHNGNIWADNNADGKGATFSFSLPL